MKLWQRILASAGIVLLCILLVLGMFVAIARSSRVQTAVVGLVAEQLSRGLGANVEVGQLDYKFPNRLLVQDVLIMDRQQDTLLYVDTLAAQMDIIKLLREDTLCINRVALNGGVLNAYKVNDSTMNYQFLADAFRSDEKRNPDSINLQVKDIELSRLRLRYDDWQGEMPEARMHLHNMTPHLLDAEIERFSCKALHNNGEGEAIPFIIDEMEAHVVFNDTLLTFPTLHVKMPKSDVRIEQLAIDRSDAKRLAAIAPNDSAARDAFLSKIKVSLRIEETRLTPSDFSAILPQCKSMNGDWSLRADLQGRIDSLEAHGLTIQFRGKDVLKGDAIAFGLPHMDSLYIKAQCQDLTTNKATLQDIISNFAGKPVVLPAIFDPLGQVHYKGELSGRLEDLTLKGALTTAIGSIRTDGRATTTPDFSDVHFEGLISTKRFDLGAMLKNKDLETIGFTVTGAGHMGKDHPFHGNLCANVDHFTYKNYTYKDVHLDGTFHDGVFDGDVHSHDPNLDFEFDGNIAFASIQARHDETPNPTPKTKVVPLYQGKLALAHLRLGELHLSEKYADADMSLGMRVNLSGASLNELKGSIEIDTLQFTHNGETLRMKELLVKADNGEESGTRSIVLTSDYLTAGASGKFRYETLPTSVMHYVATYLPKTLPTEKAAHYKAEKTTNVIQFYMYGNELDKVCDLLELPISPADQPVIKGYLNDRENSLQIKGNIPSLRLGERQLEQLTLNIDNQDQQLNAALSSVVNHGLSKTSALIGDMKVGLAAHAANDSLHLGLKWTNIEDVHHAGEIHAGARFARYNNLPLISAHIEPGVILFADSIWHIDEAAITYNAADTLIQIDHLHLGSNFQYIYANGIASRNESDSIRAELKNIDLDYFLSAISDLKKTIYFGGNVSGWATGYGILKAPLFEANVSMKKAHINGKEIGDVYAMATLDPDNKHVLIQGECFDPRLPYEPCALDKMPSRTVYTKDTLDFTYYPTLSEDIRHSGRHVVHVDGEIGGEKGQWGLTVYPDSVDISLVNHWCSSFITDLSGRGSGQVNVWGGRDADKKPYARVTLAAKPFNVGLTIPFTGGRYFVNDSIFITENAILFPKMTLRDTEGHPLTLEGKVEHDGDWRDLHYHIDVDTKRAIVLNLSEKGDELYGGKVYANGKVDIHGDEKECHINADAVSTAGSTFTFALTTANNAHDNSFIEYVDHNPKPAKEKTSKINNSDFKVFFNLQAEVTPEVLITVLLDKQSGDKLKGRAEGNLRLYYSDTELSLLGSCSILQGTFGFTFQNVIRREFQIAEGSSVTWTGNPEEPTVDIKALYGVTASLRDLFGTEASSLATSRSSVPVNCVLNLTDNLMNPVIRFGIELPSSDESVASQVRSIINTDEMLMRQVLYLLVFSKFYTPEYLQNTSNVGLNETYSLISSTVTGQINSWLGKLTDVVTLGFNFRTDGEGADASQEYEAQFEIHPVKGLLINGNFGYRYNDLSNQPIFGNLDVEYMLTPNGKLRAKAYTHTVDKYSLRQANTVQGVGFVFKHDFNWPDIKKKKEKSKSTKADTLEADSTQSDFLEFK